MKRLATFTQHKILSHYWTERTPFTVNDLVRKGILHFPALGRLALRLMESRGQVLANGKRNGELLYIATTESKNEWADIWRDGSNPVNMSGMNRYENQELIDDLNKLIETYRENGIET